MATTPAVLFFFPPRTCWGLPAVPSKEKDQQVHLQPKPVVPRSHPTLPGALMLLQLMWLKTAERKKRGRGGATGWLGETGNGALWLEASLLWKHTERQCLTKAFGWGDAITKQLSDMGIASENIFFFSPLHSHFLPAPDEPSCVPQRFPSVLHLPHTEKHGQVNMRRWTGSQRSNHFRLFAFERVVLQLYDCETQQ